MRGPCARTHARTHAMLTHARKRACQLNPGTPSTPPTHTPKVYMSIDLLVSRGSLDIVRSLADAAAALESLGPAGAKARKAKAMQDRALGAVAAQQARQIGK
jgi:hypothetical protein